MSRVGAEEREKITALLRKHGGNQNKVARMCGRNQSTVRRIARAAGIESINAAPKKALEVKAAIEEIERGEIIRDILATGQTLLGGVKEPRDYKDVVTGLAIGIDKHRLETGEATSRTETVDPARRQLFRENLDEVARKRRERMG